jgi:hypothetical protein
VDKTRELAKGAKLIDAMGLVDKEEVRLVKGFDALREKMIEAVNVADDE